MPSNLPFQIGERVKHIVGGPIMVVVWVDELVTCEWFNTLDMLERVEFQPFLLEPVPVLTAQRQAG